MGNGAKTKEAEQKAKIAEQQTQTAQANAEAERIKAATMAQEQVKIRPEAENILTRANKTLAGLDSGNLQNVPGVMNYLNGIATARETASRVSPTGSAALATDVANPTLLAMNNQRINAETANQTAAGVDLLARETERNAVQDVTNISGMDLSAKTGAINFMFQNAGLAGNNADRAAGGADRALANYTNERNRRGFWENLATTAVASAGGAAGAYFGRK